MNGTLGYVTPHPMIPEAVDVLGIIGSFEGVFRLLILGYVALIDLCSWLFIYALNFLFRPFFLDPPVVGQVPNELTNQG